MSLSMRICLDRVYEAWSTTNLLHSGTLCDPKSPILQPKNVFLSPTNTKLNKLRYKVEEDGLLKPNRDILSAFWADELLRRYRIWT